jgi:hypothetical protein
MGVPRAERIAPKEADKAAGRHLEGRVLAGFLRLDGPIRVPFRVAHELAEVQQARRTDAVGEQIVNDQRGSTHAENDKEIFQ